MLFVVVLLSVDSACFGFTFVIFDMFNGDCSRGTFCSVSKAQVHIHYGSAMVDGSIHGCVPENHVKKKTT